MSEKVVFIPNGEKIYAVPVGVCEKYALSGEALTAATKAMAEATGDVEGQTSTGEGSSSDCSDCGIKVDNSGRNSGKK
jgi:hypothetical protein